MSKIENSGIFFYDEVLKGKVYKVGASTSKNPDIGFINQYKDPDRLEEIIANLNKAINGNFNLINDPDITVRDDIAFITPSGIEFYDEDGQHVIATLALEDFKEIVEAWLNFLLSPPFHGSEIWYYRPFTHLRLNLKRL